MQEHFIRDGGQLQEFDESGHEVRRKRQMNKINRDDMLELTRRMTPKRNCFSRIAGAYFDEA